MKKCYFCKAAVRRRKVRAIRQHKGKVFIIEDVPAQVCPQCGQEFYRGPVLEEMDRLMDSDESVESEIRVPIVRFKRKLVA